MKIIVDVKECPCLVQNMFEKLSVKICQNVLHVYYDKAYFNTTLYFSSDYKFVKL